MVGLCIGLWVSACRSSEPIAPGAEPVRLSIPENFPPPLPDDDNPLTRQGIELGRRLFYDTRLSANNKVACATCHQQALAFSDGVALSAAGVSGTALLRHAPALLHLAWAGNGLFWDGGSTNLESQAFAPLTAHDEMGQDLYLLEEKLRADPYYPEQFRSAFGQEIASGLVVKALAQFQRTLISANSRYDRYVRNEPGGWMTASERQGLALVRQKCQGCHAGALFTDNLFHNNGLDSAFENRAHDQVYLGRYRISYREEDLGAYRTPTLRNVMLTAPYMHDGRFGTMAEVLDHYDKQVKHSPSLDRLLSTPGNRPGIRLTADEKKYITAFLHTLTDEAFVKEESFGRPPGP